MKDKKDGRGYFGTTNKRFYFEYRCSNPISKESLCTRCLEWKTKSWKERGLKKKDPYREYYGLITEPIPDNFYGSTWYESKVKEVGEPSESDMVKAKKAQEEAHKNTVVLQTADTNTEPKKRGRPKQKPAPVPVPPPPPSPSPPPQPQPNPSPPPNPKPKPTKRRTKPTLPQKEQKETTQVQAIEASPPLLDIEIVKIIVKPFRHDNVDYFRDTKKNKLYASGKDKRPSQYVGRWNPETETIDHEFPDSDAE